MRGELGIVWPATWKEIWTPLMRHREFGDDLALDLFRERVGPPKLSSPASQLSVEDLDKFQAAVKRHEEAVASVSVAKVELRKRWFSKPISETVALDFLEKSYSIFEEYDDANFANEYFNRVERFLDRYSLRYDLRRPLTLHPTLSGMFSSLIKELTRVARQDAHLHQLLLEFQESVRDLRDEVSQGRVKTCLQKQFNLLEAIARNYPGVTRQTLGAMCSEINSWPHPTVRDALKTLYGFRSDYPGLGHAGNPNAVLRDLNARDMVALGVMLAGFVPYLTDLMDASVVYGR